MKTVFLATGLLALLVTAPAKAVLINFDDIDLGSLPPDFDPTYDDYPTVVIDNQYRDQGVDVFGEPLLQSVEWAGDEGTTSAPNSLVGREYGFEFITDQAPSFVSFYITTVLEDAPFVYIYDTDDHLLERRAMDGWQGTPETSTPWRPEQLVEIHYPDIGAVRLTGLFNRPFSVVVDDLRFEYSDPVTEPAGLGVLLISGLTLLAVRSRRRGVYPGT